MGYRVLYIEQSEHLRLYLDNLKVETEQGDLTIPLADIQTLIVDNNRTVMTTRLLNALTENHVCTILCGVDHLPCSFILPMNGHFAQSGNIFKQMEWSDEIKQKLHAEIAKAKIGNQMKVLIKYHGSDSVLAMMDRFKSEVQDGDTGNREGLAAKVYFRELFGNDFARFDDDVINAGLNYGYSIFRSLIASVIVSKGYLPNIGLFHKGRENMFNLADDLIEVFRPVVDDYVRENMIDSLEFTKENREELIRLSLGRLNFDGMTQTVGNTVTVYFENILQCIEKNDVSGYKYPDCQISYDI